MDVMKKTIVRSNRTVAVIVPPESKTAAAEGGH